VTENQDDVVVYYGQDTQAVILELVSGQVYQYKVYATSLVGDSEWSSISSFLIADAPTPPINVSLVDYDNSFVSLQWNQPLSDGGQTLINFHIYRKDCSQAETEAILLTSPNANTFFYKDESVTGGTLYEYYLTAENTIGGESDSSFSF
jgi:fibronectin type 3 domain-containing protein